MELFTDIRVILCLSLCVLLHVLAAVLPRVPSLILGYADIAWHAAFTVLLSFFGKSIEEAVLVYLISLFAYTVTQLIRYRIILKKSDKVGECGEEEGAR